MRWLGLGSRDARPSAFEWIFLIAIIPGAFVGAFAAPWIPAAPLSLVVSACVAFAGLSCLRERSQKAAIPTIEPGMLTSLGVVTGFLVGHQRNRRPADLYAIVALERHGCAPHIVACAGRTAARRRDGNLVNGLADSVDFVRQAIVSVAIVAGMLAGVSVSQRIETMFCGRPLRGAWWQSALRCASSTCGGSHSPDYSASPFSNFGISPVKPAASRINMRLSAGMRSTNPSPMSRASRSTSE